ncbi:TonB-dependent vitamin B12 receptor [Thiocystis violacea]|uniref:TonB-dependent vitamin B12 receptor n=1 Tax=Thiocystis violacea TaxID=13725 RepID=UPI0019087BD0|nr:TonB-dependent vitamin B12 receptor [Thiocystis violacea]MBK1719453.1 TonB-dependent vitamin B12 receptor [Thiocystis violacea]
MNHSWMLVALGAPLAGLAVADETPTLLEPVVVTATRTAEPRATTLASVTVIDRAEIERRQARSVPDLLRGVPGVILSQTGGAGQHASVFLRGTNSDHVLVLIDGVKIGSATSGTAPFEDLPIEQIERIEVVRGPRSSLYGSEAIGGVIQIFTKRGGGPLARRLTLGGGTLGTAKVAAGVSGGGERGWFNLGANLDRTDGIDACAGRAKPAAGCRVDQPDRDPYRNLGMSLRGGYAFGETATLDLHLLGSENRADFDGSALAGNESRSEQQVLGARSTFKPLDPWILTLAAGRSWDAYRVFFDDPETSGGAYFLDRFETERDTLSLQNDIAIGAARLLTLGADYQDDRVSGTVDYARRSRDNLGLFGEYQDQFGPANLKLSLRQDDNGQFGDHGTGNAALGYRLDNGIQVSLSHGTAFKAPSFNDLYYPYYGNPDLDPEQSRSLELGVNGPLALGAELNGRWDLALYETDIDDLIAYDANLSAAANVRRARIRGLEASGSVGYRNWDLKANLTLMDPENRSSGSSQGNLLPRRPEQSVQIDLDRRFERWSAGASLFIAGRRFDDLANQTRLDGYALLDLRAEYAINDALRVQARLENAFDEDYETAYLYNQPGRSFYLTLRYEPSLSR